MIPLFTLDFCLQIVPDRKLSYGSQAEEGTQPNIFYNISITLLSKPEEDIIGKNNYRSMASINIIAKNVNKI